MKIDPDKFTQPFEVDKVINYPCPFCGNDLEFQFGESMQKTELTFLCQKDQKKFTVTKL